MEKKKIIIIIISIIIIAIISIVLYWDFTRIIEKPLDIKIDNKPYTDNSLQGYNIYSTNDSIVVTIYRNSSLIKDITTYVFENNKCKEIITESHYESKAEATSMNKDNIQNYKRKGNIIYSKKENTEITETKDELFEHLQNQYDKTMNRID